MIRLLKIEFAKFRDNSTINLLLFLFLLFMLITMFALRDLTDNLPPPIPGTTILYEFPTVWDYQGYLGNWLVFFFVGCVMIFVVTNEVSFKTQRQNIITGLTRKEFFGAKLLNLLALSVGATVVYGISTFLIGAIYTPDLDFAIIFDNNMALSRFFLMCIGYLSFALMVAFIMRKSGLALFSYMSYVLIIEFILRAIYYYYTEHQSVFYFPLNVIEDNMPLPLLRLAGFLDEEMPFNFLLPYWQAALLTIGFSALFIFLAYRSFMSRDI